MIREDGQSYALMVEVCYFHLHFAVCADFYIHGDILFMTEVTVYLKESSVREYLDILCY